MEFIGILKESEIDLIDLRHCGINYLYMMVLSCRILD